MSRPTENTELRAQLLAVKLRALVGDHLGAPVDVEPSGLPSGAGLLIDGAAWVLIDGPAARSLGPALAWAIRQGATSLHVVAETDTGVVARRAAEFELPISVWFAEGRSLLPAIAEAHEPPVEPDPAHLALADMIEAGGADPTVEHGVVTGEVRGLEVCRVVDEATIGRLVELGEIDLDARVADRGVRLEVGVGANDREAFQLIHGDLPTVEALTGVVGAVREYRSVDAPQHPLNRMAPERFLRWQAIRQPTDLGFVTLVPAGPPVPRPSMKDQEPAVAIAVDDASAEHVVVFSTGVDLDLVPFALDAAIALARWGHRNLDATITVVLRDNDLVPITREIAEHAARPIRFVTV